MMRQVKANDAGCPKSDRKLSWIQDRVVGLKDDILWAGGRQADSKSHEGEMCKHGKQDHNRQQRGL
jgi:hypothetical protein